jgi:hypothetical protein
MSTLSLTAPRTPGYSVSSACRMEWIKLRSLRSTWWALGLTIAAAIGLGIVGGLGAKTTTVDVTNNVLSGMAVGLLVTGVLGVLMCTNEYGSGLVRTTLAAVPDRRVLLTAKAVVLGATALVVGELAALVSFVAGTSALPAAVPAPSITDPAVVRAIVLGGAGYALIGVLGVGIGAIVRHTPAAIGVLVGGVYVVGQALGASVEAVRGYVPVGLVSDSLATTRSIDHAPSPWVGLLVLMAYAAVALGGGAWPMSRRDA